MYGRLEISAGEFRLLTLQPGQTEDPLIGLISTESLTGYLCPAYETISYHWGGLSSREDSDGTHVESCLDQCRIEVSGNQVAIPFRAEQALRCMRLADRDRRIWIDSICINQSDAEEKEQQIAVMGDIYKNGTRNLVHLDGGDKDQAFAGVRALKSGYRRLQAELRLLPEDVQRRWREYRIKPNGWSKLESPPVLLDNAWPVKLMFKCAWFTRLWIVQETCLASENMCHWANEQFDLQELMDVVHVSRELEVAADTDNPDLHKTYCCLQQLRYPLLLGRQFRSGRVDNPLEALMALVDVLRHCDVRYGHDRIFAVAGLLHSLPGATTESMKLLGADYKKSLTSVFRDATRVILLSSRSDVLLTKASHRDVSEMLDAKKPSWSFYWDRPQDLMQESGRPTLAVNFHAGILSKISRQQSSFVIGADDNPDILSLRGFLLGTTEQFIPYVSKGKLHSDITTTRRLIETILPMARARPSSTCCQNCDPEPGGSDGKTRSKVAAEALQRREVERAHEVVRRRLSRRIGDMQIEAYSEANSALLNSDSEHAPVLEEEPADYLQSREDHRIDMTAITVLSAGWCAAQYPDESDAVKAFRKLRMHMQSHGELPFVLSDAFNMHMLIAAGSHNRCFFTTRFGDVGCGPKIMQAGDEVAVFLGASYPYILRPTAPFDGTYRFVGMAIIPGIMHGETLKTDLPVQTIQLC